MSDEVLVERRDQVLVITINRPQARNAVNRAVSEGVAAAIDELDADRALTLGVITGAGGSFCSGMDLKAFLTGERPSIPGRGFAGLTQAPPKKPLIAAVEGYALAGGCEIVLACDLVVASTAASFGLPEVKRSLVAAAGGLFRLPRAVPPGVAMHLALTGEPMGAERAYHYGLVQELCQPGEALDTALGLASRINSNAPLAVRATRKVILDSLGAPEDQGWRSGEQAMAAISRTEDFREGPLAFVEKRAPVWTGR
jgi:enoyl-CoA hydratase